MNMEDGEEEGHLDISLSIENLLEMVLNIGKCIQVKPCTCTFLFRHVCMYQCMHVEIYTCTSMSSWEVNMSD